MQKKNSCINAIKNFQKMYEKDLIVCETNREKNNQKIVMMKKIIEECIKDECPKGYYKLHGKCEYS